MSTERDELIADLYASGHSQRGIARTVGLSQPTVRKRLRKLGLLVSRDTLPAKSLVHPGAPHDLRPFPADTPTAPTVIKAHDFFPSSHPDHSAAALLVNASIQQRISEATKAIQKLGWEMRTRRGVCLGDVHQWGHQLLALTGMMEEGE